MKTIVFGLISILMFVSVEQEQTKKTVTATFDGYEDGVYSFSNGEDEVFDFERIAPEVLKEFDLKSTLYVKKKFKITYKEETFKDEDGEEDEEYEVWTITKLELVKE